jgi:hypothetical protein
MQRWTWYIFYALTVGLPIAILVVLLIGGRLLPQDQRVTWSDLTPFVLLPTIALVGVPLMQLYNAYAHKRVHTIPHTEHTVALSDAGLEVACVVARVVVPWAAIYRVVETAQFFLFYINKRCAYYIPKRAVTGLAQQNQIRQWVQARVGLKARLLAPAA